MLELLEQRRLYSRATCTEPTQAAAPLASDPQVASAGTYLVPPQSMPSTPGSPQTGKGAQLYFDLPRVPAPDAFWTAASGIFLAAAADAAVFRACKRHLR